MYTLMIHLSLCLLYVHPNTLGVHPIPDPRQWTVLERHYALILH